MNDPLCGAPNTWLYTKSNIWIFIVPIFERKQDTIKGQMQCIYTSVYLWNICFKTLNTEWTCTYTLRHINFVLSLHGMELRVFATVFKELLRFCNKWMRRV